MSDANKLLLEAALKPSLSSVKEALEQNADPNTTDDKGNTALHLVVTKSFRLPDTIPIIKTLLEHKANIEQTNANGNTPVEVALMSGWQDNAAFLLKNNAKFDQARAKEVKIRCSDCTRLRDQFLANGGKFGSWWKFENAALND